VVCGEVPNMVVDFWGELWEECGGDGRGVVRCFVIVAAEVERCDWDTKDIVVVDRIAG